MSNMLTLFRNNFPKFQKLLKLLDVITDVKIKNESVFIKFKKDLMIETGRHGIIYSPNGDLMMKSNILHLQPEITFKDINKNVETIIEKTTQLNIENDHLV